MKRERYVEKLKSDLDRLNARADAWEAKVSSMRAGLRTHYERQLAALDGRREVAAGRLHELQSASTAAWRDVAKGYDQAWRQLRTAFDRARSHFRRQAGEQHDGQRRDGPPPP